MNIALFFGSFNPIHNGHIHIANYIIEHSICEEVWFVVSPQNPLKKDAFLLEDSFRLNITKKVINNVSKFKLCDIEFSLPKPSYTYNTLNIIRNKYQEHNFYLIIGSDNLNIFHKWMNYKEIINEFNIIVYPRKGCDISDIKTPNTIILKADLKDISSTEVRDRIKKDKSINTLVPECIVEDILKYYSDIL